MRRWWLVVALLLSLGMNVGLLVAVGLRRLAQEGRITAPLVNPGRVAPPAARLERMADRLELAGEERRRFLEIQRRFFETTWKERQTIAWLRRDLRRELTAPAPDRERIDEILAELGRHYASLERAIARTVLETREILDDQQERLYLRFLRRLRPGAAPPSGREGPGSRSRPRPSP